MRGARGPEPKRRHALTVLLALAAVALAVLGAGVTSMAAPAPERLLVADLRGHALLLLDPDSLAEVQRIDLPGAPHELLRLPDGRVLTSIEQGGILAAVDLEAGDVEVLPVGGVPHGLALDGDTVLVTDRSRDAVRRFAVEGWREIEQFATGGWPHVVGVTPAGLVAVAAASAGRLEVGDADLEVGRTTETLDVRADGVVAAAAATDGVVVAYREDGQRIGAWDVGGRPVRVRFSPDGTTLAVALSAGGAVALIDAEGVRTLDVTGVPDGLAFSGDGDRLYVSDVYGGHVTVLDLEGGVAIGTARAGEGTGALLILPR